MSYMIVRKADARTEAGTAPERGARAAVAAWHAELARAGLLGLHLELLPSAQAMRLRLWDGGAELTPGPFTPASALVAGLTVVQTDSLAEAIAWARRWPAAGGATELEVRATGCPGGCATVPVTPGEAGQRYVVLLRADAATERDAIPDQTRLDALNAFNAREVAAGVLLAGDGLKSSARGARVRPGAAPPAVLDGPFAEAKELIAGFWMIRAADPAAALAWARRVPYPTGPEVEVEIRCVALSDAARCADQQWRAVQLEAAQRAELAGAGLR